MKYNRFDHEQQIMDCWGVIDDLKIIREGVLSGNLSSDQIATILSGLDGLYQLKFEKLFEFFSASIKEEYENKISGVKYDKFWVDESDPF